ncbi:unnamed protein product [Caenorhabditis bovis]|uniref:Uncharacterized protein n=1 Tax=Caenorhabditis bovis TaxID=2654633 RepID=A0A8S1F9A3_9PELO|nr:unnamed protein product [Caenorhabditis bovis]
MDCWESSSVELFTRKLVTIRNSSIVYRPETLEQGKLELVFFSLKVAKNWKIELARIQLQNFVIPHFNKEKFDGFLLQIIRETSSTGIPLILRDGIETTTAIYNVAESIPEYRFKCHEPPPPKNEPIRMKDGICKWTRKNSMEWERQRIENCSAVENAIIVLDCWKRDETLKFVKNLRIIRNCGILIRAHEDIDELDFENIIEASKSFFDFAGTFLTKIEFAQKAKLKIFENIQMRIPKQRIKNESVEYLKGLGNKIDIELVGLTVSDVHVYDLTDIELEPESRAVCRGIFEQWAQYQKILMAQAIYTDDNGKIVGLALCQVPVADCPLLGVETSNVYLLIGIQLITNTMHLKDVEFQYDDTKFQITNSSKWPIGAFVDRGNLFFNRILVKGKQRFEAKSSCHEKILQKEQAESILFGNGYYVYKFEPNERGFTTMGWKSMYFQPRTLGKFIVDESRHLNPI